MKAPTARIGWLPSPGEAAALLRPLRCPMRQGWGDGCLSMCGTEHGLDTKGVSQGDTSLPRRAYCACAARRALESETGSAA
jgi:hypothetical protein